MKIAFTYNVKHHTPSGNLSEQSDLEFDSPYVINSIKSALQELGHEIIEIEADENAFERLKSARGNIDLVFNIAEGLWGDARESQIPLFCEILRLPYTHSSPTTHAVALDKEYSKLLLKGAGITVPESYTIKNLEFPCIIKPNKEGSSKGVMDKNVVDNKEEFERVLAEITKLYDGEVLIEEYIDGREFTVAVLGDDKLQVLPIIEQKFDFLPAGMHKIASFELKWEYEDALANLADAYDCPAKLTDQETKLVEKTSEKIFRTLNCKDAVRIDYRMAKNGKLYFIEINTLPGINPDPDSISYFPLAARTAGLSFTQLIGKILDSAAKRYNLNR